jgi:peptidoglycan/xylan/chitin deacetylase (PgdA/CDA1 family)
MRLFQVFVFGVVFLGSHAAAALAADCNNPDALGVSRTLVIDPRAYPLVGTVEYAESLRLKDREVVLTFDDGPWPPTTPMVLAALARECVHATFFLIGKPASEHPELVRRIAAEGHTIGHHTWTHRSLMQIPPGETTEEIDHGISADELALHGIATTIPSTPFFRFPGFETTPATLALLQSRGIVVFGTDLWASDWIRMSPSHELKLIIDRLKTAGKGIILFHDPKMRTATMLPAFLRYLRENHYRVVHLVPAGAGVDFDGVP